MRAVPPPGVTPSVTLSPLEFDVVWSHLQLGPFPTVYRLLGHGETYEERDRLVAVAWDRLESRGLGGPTSLDRDLADLLRVLAAPRHEVDLRMNAQTGVVRALAGAVGDDAVVGVLRGGEFELSTTTPGSIVTALTALLPDHPHGHGPSVTLASTTFDAACKAAPDGSPKKLREALLERGMRPADAGQLAEALTDVSAMGQLGAAMLDGWGRRRRGSHVVAFVDSATGRYLLEAKPSNGEQWTTIAPTDASRIAGQVERLRGALAAEIE